MSLCNRDLNDTLNYNLLFLANVLTNNLLFYNFSYVVIDNQSRLPRQGKARQRKHKCKTRQHNAIKVNQGSKDDNQFPNPMQVNNYSGKIARFMPSILLAPNAI